MAGSYTVKVDWNGDGDFLDTGENVTSRIYARSGDTVQCSVGRDTARNLSPGSAGSASFTLNNRSRDYSPDNGSSPLTGLVGPGRKVQIAAASSSTSGNLFTGYIDNFDIDPSRSNRAVDITCVDGMGLFSGVRVSTPVHAGYRTGTAIATILSAAGYTGSSFIDNGATVLPFWWLDDVDALSAIQDIVKAEGPPAIAYFDEDGVFNFRDRHHRYVNAASTSSQATFRDSGAEPKHSEPFGYDAGFRDIVNSVAFDVPTYYLGEVATVWTNPSKVVVPASTVVTFTVTTDNPIDTFAASGVGLSWSYSGTSPSWTNFTELGGSAFVIEFTGGASGGVIWNVAMTGTPVLQADSIRVSSSDATSITRYGTRSWDETSLPWAGQYDAQAVADQIVAMRKDRNPAVSITVRSGGRDNSYDTRLNQSIARDISDRITIVEAETGVNRDAFIERKDHSISWSSRIHETVYSCDTSDTAAAGNLFKFDGSGRGFNQGVFAR